MGGAMDLFTVFQKVGLALGLGLLVGLQRQRVESWLAGIRTFPLITVLGTVCALLGDRFGGWVLAAGALGLTALIVTAVVAKMQAGPIDPGVTTEVAALLMYGVGAYLVVGHASVAIAVGGGIAVLLHWKEPLHSFVARIGAADLTAIMQFVLITLVILPVLPDQTYGEEPFNVLNPHKIWLMVVLIVGLSLAGYVAYKLFGQGAGTLLGGLLGGLISSTATTVSAARRTAEMPNTAGLAAAVIMTASAVSSARVLVELAVVAPFTFWQVAPPMMALLAWKVVLSGAAYLAARGDKVEMAEQKNPAELKSALVFGALYAVVLLAVAAARLYLGSTGLYAVAALSGLTDLDAITLSTGQMVEEARLEAATGWRLVLLAALSNLAFKGGAVAVLGHRSLLRRVAVLFGLTAAAGALILVLWPGG
jgi:uncharacterized membrane protein (DUF4010 family)